jgi:hypothetical protein
MNKDGLLKFLDRRAEDLKREFEFFWQLIMLSQCAIKPDPTLRFDHTRFR